MTSPATSLLHKERKEFFHLISIFAPIIIAVLALFFHFFSSYFSSFPQNEKWFSLLSRSSATSIVGEKGELSGANKIALGQKIDINHATVEDLTALPAVGPKLAEKIVEDRNRNGSFKKIESLMRVKGIKEKKFEKLRPFISSF